jgi:transposase InsO family protein
VLVVVAGAFAAGALIFPGGDENVVESQLTCSDEDGDMPADCSGYVADELEAQCVEGVDAVKITMAYEDDDRERYASRTYTEDYYNQHRPHGAPGHQPPRWRLPAA